MIRTLLLAGAVLAIGACADRNEYKVVDAHGWPVSTWDAAGADYLVLRCPARVVELPRVADEIGPNPGLGEGRIELASQQRRGDLVLVTGGVTRDVIVDARTRRAYDDRYCYDNGLGIAETTQPRTVRIAVHHRPLAPTEDRAAPLPSDATSYATGTSAVTSSPVVPTMTAAPGAMSRIDTTR